ncbi:MAG: acyltransferase [Proteobacteria bacterium]|nr:acyltransferase [Pseudomonadota bacterium]
MTQSEVSIKESIVERGPTGLVQHSERHFPGLDTLLACAILLVIGRHAWEILKWPSLKVFFGHHGWVGVDLFFVLSGFLIGSQLLQSVKRDGRVNFPRFYFKRSLRILPAYFAVLLLYFVWPDFRETPSLEPAWRFILFVMNFGVKAEAFSHAWSLCVEEHFYLAFPLIVSL